MIYSEELEYIVAAANVAGYLEKADQIVVSDDCELTCFLVALLNAWGGEKDTFVDYADEKLRERFGDVKSQKLFPFKLYERYQLRWMLDHEKSLQDLLGELEDMQYEDPEDEDRVSTPVLELFQEWKQKGGFNQGIWHSRKEWEEIHSRAE